MVNVSPIPHHARRNFFSRLYSSAKVIAPVDLSDEDDHDFSGIPCDFSGLPLTSSDLLAPAWQQSADDSGDLYGLTQQGRKVEQEQYAQAVTHLYKAARAIPINPPEDLQEAHTHGAFMPKFLAKRESSGLRSLQDLHTLKEAVEELSTSYLYADPSIRGCQLRQREADNPGHNGATFRITSLRRKAVPQYLDDVVDKGTLESAPGRHHSPDVYENLASNESDKLNHSPKMRDIYTGRALRKLEVSGAYLSDDEEVEKCIRTSQHPMQRYASQQHLHFDAAMGRTSKDKAKSHRRRTSIMSCNMEDIKTYLLVNSGGVNVQGNKSEFLDSLDDGPRRATAPAVPFSAAHKRNSSDEESESNYSSHLTSSSMDLTSSSNTTHDEVSSISSGSTRFSSPQSETSLLFSTPPNSHNIPLPQCDAKWMGEGKGERLMPNQFQVELQPRRPKRHPARKRDSLALMAKKDQEPVRTIIRQTSTLSICDPFDEIPCNNLLQYDQLMSSSDDTTPRPNALGFRTGLAI